MKGATEVRPPRLTIQVDGRYLHELTEDALNALVASNEPPVYFVHGGLLVRLGNQGRLEALNTHALKGVLDRCANFVRGSKETPARPPNDLVQDILALPGLPLPKLESISQTPIFLPDGRLLAQDGYDAASGVLVRLNGLKAIRTDMPVTEARDLLRNVFTDFPFVDGAGFAHTLALILQPFVRLLIDGPTPLYLVEAPKGGTGKGLLLEVATLISQGSDLAVSSLPGDDSELEKRITADLIAGERVFLFDEAQNLRSKQLNAALTGVVWKGRILGKSEMVEVPNRALWLATGNNVELSDEIARRTVSIRLDANEENPEERRNFVHPDLNAYVRQNRGVLVNACLSLVTAWVSEGMPSGVSGKTLGRFESWVSVIDGILSVSGVSGVLSDRSRLHSTSDAETVEWAALCRTWWDRYEERSVTAKDVLELMRSGNLLLDVWAARSDTGAVQRVGHALGRKRNRVFAELTITPAGIDSTTGNKSYKLSRIIEKTKKTPETPESASVSDQNGQVFSVGGEVETPETPEGSSENAEDF